MSTQYEIARLLFEWDLRWHPEPRPTWDSTTERHRDTFIEAADAILAAFPILRDELPDAVVEAAARADYEHAQQGDEKPWRDLGDRARGLWLGAAHDAVAAAREVRDA